MEDIIDTEQRARIVTKLHEILRPFVLRRLKRDVLDATVYPPKRDVVLYCGMSLLQQVHTYQQIFAYVTSFQRLIAVYITACVGVL